MKRRTSTPSKSGRQSSPGTGARRRFLLSAFGGGVSAAVVLGLVWFLAAGSTPRATPTVPSAAQPAGDPIPIISVSALRERIEKGGVAVIDVRDMNSYLAGHIPGSLHIPVAYVAGEVPYLPRDRGIVTYCSCPAEESSGYAALLLRQHGFSDVAALVGGLDAWIAEGNPIATGLERP
ncbi:MAG TPA: rhodanese-like domain-containing protein [Thermoanaerobaculia bacterium]|nr:rhodanese-like domain-containing protein [Thermoanaerobaculia bacterium]